MRKIRLRYLIFIFICLSALSCSRQDSVAPVVIETNTGYVPGIQAGNFAPGQLEAHYQKHGYQFGNITQEQYLEKAQALLNAAPGKDIMEKRRANGDILHYRLSTGEFAVMTVDGRIKTYFIADYQYWMRQ